MEREAVSDFERDLRAAVRGEVHFDAGTLGIYSTDASIYQIQPVAVVIPLDEDDVRAAIAAAAGHSVSILPRGGGTSLAGQMVGESLIIDFSKHMNRLLEVNPGERWARVQPGLVRDELNAMLAKHGLHFAPDPATSSRANVGGMIGNNSSGTKSIIYGKTVDHVLETRVLLADGTEMNLREMSGDQLRQTCDGNGRIGEIHRGVRDIVEANRDEIARRYPKVMRRVGGYNLDELLDTDRWNLAKLITGSEGTLATLLEAKINLEPLPRCTSVCVAHFAELQDALHAVAPILAHGPSAVEIMDRLVITRARKNLSLAPLCGFIQGEPEAVLIIEFFGDSPEEVARKARGVAADLEARGHGFAMPVFLDAASLSRVWTVRKSALGLMLGIKGNRKPIPFIEDACVPIEVLPEYIGQVIEICRGHGTDVTMYAHASVGVIHVRPILDLHLAEDVERMKAIAEETFQLVQRYGGSWSGEHGDGLVRSRWMERFFGPQIYGALKQVKGLFDPGGLMNPGKIIDSPPMDENLRYGGDYRVPELVTVHRFRDDGSFAAAVEMCTGVGECRKTLDGAMCPSYRATRDEMHSTRGRANALRLAMTGQLGPGGMTSDQLFEVLDLCLSCKSCKSECPSNVDVARLKSEMLQLRRDRNGTSLRDRMIAASPRMARRLSGGLAPLANWVQRRGLFRWSLERMVGFDRRRRLPDYARIPLRRWFERRRATAPKSSQRVVLFDDTYLSCHDTHVGQAAVELLESCGYEVALARAGCCQRPRISHGFLREAKRDGEKTLRALDEFIRQGLTVVVCEPSCASALVDDLPDLIADEELGQRIRSGVMMIDDFLAQEISAGRLACEFASPHSEILIHGHCHQRAIFGTSSMLGILSRIPGLRVSEISSGCCGMAGSFGYEREHVDLSLQVGEQSLMPAIRDRPDGAEIVACGFSCRHQIEHSTGVRARHWVETLRGTAR